MTDLACEVAVLKQRVLSIEETVQEHKEQIEEQKGDTKEILKILTSIDLRDAKRVGFIGGVIFIASGISGFVGFIINKYL